MMKHEVFLAGRKDGNIYELSSVPIRRWREYS